MINIETTRVLLLDQAMQPIEVISARKAIEKLFEGKVDVLEEYEDVLMRSARLTLKLPSVIMLSGGRRHNRRFVKFSRPNIFWRDDHRCQYCGKRVHKDKLTLDHVIPKARRTPESYKSWTNIVSACKSCNAKKKDRTPEQAGMKLLKKPYKPEWEPAMTVHLLETDPPSWKAYLEPFL